MEVVERPACSNEVWGYGVTLYCYSSGVDELRADAAWANALEQVVPVLIASAEGLLAVTDQLDQNGRLS